MKSESIQQVLNYIESNLKSEITVRELSDMAGFSVFHFYRLFQSAVGMPVMQYISRRKLLNAIYDMSQGRKMIDAALDYGFETYAGFYKSFVREIGYPPKEYLKRNKVKKPHRINIIKGEHIVMNQKRIRGILKNWDMEHERIADVIYGETGETSDCAKYVGEGHVIKQYTSFANAKKAIDLSKALDRLGLVSSSIIPTKDGRDYVEEASLYYVLSSRITGMHVKAGALYMEDYLEKSRFIGEIIGQLSLALAKVDMVVDEKDLRATVTNWALPKLLPEIAVDKGFLASFQCKLDALYDALPKQVIHKDPNPSNIIMSDDQWGFIDFDLSERTVRIFDPYYAASAILSESFEVGNEDKLTKWIAILREIMYGYDSVVKLTDAEKEAVPYILLANQFIATAWFLGDEKYRDLYEINMHMTEWMIRNFERLKITF